MIIDDLYVGKTLGELSKELGPTLKGYAIFVMYDPDDLVGKQLAESYSLKEILRKYPELMDAVVERDNDYYGERVLRVRVRKKV